MLTKSRLKMALSILLMLSSGTPALAYVEFKMNFTHGPGRSMALYDTGFPSAALINPLTGKPDIPDPPVGGEHLTSAVHLLGPSIQIIREHELFESGFGLSTGIILNFIDKGDSWPNIENGRTDLDQSTLPNSNHDGYFNPNDDPHPSIVPQTAANAATRSSVFLISVDASSPDFLQLYPINTEFGISNFCPSPLSGDVGCGVSHNSNFLAMYLLQGVPLRPKTLYAAVITNKVTYNNNGAHTPVARSRGLGDILNCMNDVHADQTPWPFCDASMGAKAEGDAGNISAIAYGQYRQAIGVLWNADNTATKNTYQASAIRDSIVALTVFKTGDPAAGFKKLVADALTNPNVPLGNAAISGMITPAAGEFPSGMPDYGVNYGSDSPPVIPFGQDGVLSQFCVYKAHIANPIYQGYTDHFFFNNVGNPVWLSNSYQGRIFITLPRTPMPPNGYPVVIMAREGGGGDIPLVDRGTEWNYYPGYGGGTCGVDVCDYQAGEGPALYFARAGYAAVQIDDPAGGERRPSDKQIHEEDAIYFDTKSLYKTRDYLREMALELAILGGKVLPTLAIPYQSVQNCTVVDCTYDTSNGNTDPSLGRTCSVRLDGSSNPVTIMPPSCVQTGQCSGLIKFDVSKLALMGHSVGASVGQVALTAVDSIGTPIFKRAIFSGSGASIMDNLLHKEEPAMPNIPLTTGRHGMRGVLESWAIWDRKVNSEGDPALNIVQYAMEPWDAQAYNAVNNINVVSGNIDRPSPGYLLQFQGLLDHYIPVPISNASVLSLGLGLGVTHRMASSAEWSAGLDNDKKFFYGPNMPSNPPWDQNLGDEWIDDPSSVWAGWLLFLPQWQSGAMFGGNASKYHDARGMQPLSTVIDLGGWNNKGVLLKPSNWGIAGNVLPQRGKSLVIQVANSGLIRESNRLQTDWSHPYNPRNATSTNSDGNYKQDGHEVMFQYFESKQKYQCFLKSALLDDPVNPMGAIIADDIDQTINPPRAGCCKHRPDVAGDALMNNCSTCAKHVCAQPGFSYCCDQANLSNPGWDQFCSNVAKPLPFVTCSMPWEPGGIMCGTPWANHCFCHGTTTVVTPPPPAECNPGNPDL